MDPSKNSPLSRLFGHSPFKALREHIREVDKSADLLREYFDATAAGDWTQAEALHERISACEHEADDLKDKIAYYLERPEERREIAERGYQYAVDHASIEARARQLWEYLATLA